MLPIGDAFETDAHFIVVSPPKDKDGISTRYMIVQRALACLGVEFEYQMRSVSCETFVLALLKPTNDSFDPIQRGLVRSHKRDLPSDEAKSQLEKDKENYQKFHQMLLSRMKNVSNGMILILEFFKKVDPGLLLREFPWFKEMQESYQMFWESCSRYLLISLDLGRDLG